jgi:hypothetical protein
MCPKSDVKFHDHVMWRRIGVTGQRRHGTSVGVATGSLSSGSFAGATTTRFDWIEAVAGAVLIRVAKAAITPPSRCSCGLLHVRL